MPSLLKQAAASSNLIMEKNASRLRKAVKVVEEHIPLRTHPKPQKNFYLELEGKRVAELILDPEDNMVIHSMIDPKFRGLGLGKKLYGEAMRRVPKIESGMHVSDSARRVWKSMSKNKGYSLKTRLSVPGNTPAHGPGVQSLPIGNTIRGAFESKLTSKARVKPTPHVLPPYWEKTAAPRWVKEFEHLAPALQKRLLSVVDKERTVRHLGSGVSRIADLVIRPGVGLQVRKVPRLFDSSKKSLKEAIQQSERQLVAETRLRDIAGGKGPFAHLQGGTPQRAYYDYAKGKTHPDIKAYEMSIGDAAEGRRAQRAYHKKLVADEKSGKLTTSQANNLERKYNATVAKPIQDRVYELRAGLQAERSLGTEGDAVISKLKKDYPDLYDIRHANIVGGRLVDFEPMMLHRESRVFKSPLPKSVSESAFSRRAFLGTPKTASLLHQAAQSSQLVLEKTAGSRLRTAVRLVENKYPMPGGTQRDFTMRMGDTPVGTMTVDTSGRVGGVVIEKAFRGLGLGKKLYGEVIRRVGKLESGSEVSDSAQRVWKSMERTPGYKVKRRLSLPNQEKFWVTGTKTAPTRWGKEGPVENPRGVFEVSLTEKARLHQASQSSQRALEKSARVPTAVKQYRRALQMMEQGALSHRSRNMKGVLDSGTIKSTPKGYHGAGTYFAEGRNYEKQYGSHMLSTAPGGGALKDEVSRFQGVSMLPWARTLGKDVPVSKMRTISSTQPLETDKALLSQAQKMRLRVVEGVPNAAAQRHHDFNKAPDKVELIRDLRKERAGKLKTASLLQQAASISQAVLEKTSGAVGKERIAYGALAGALTGGAAGASADEDNRLRGALLGALGGGALGSGGGALYNKLNPVRLRKPSIHSQPFDNTSKDLIQRGLGHGPQGKLDQYGVSPEVSEIIKQHSAVSIAGKDIVGDSKKFTDSARRKGHDVVVTVYPKGLDSAGRYSPVDVHYPGGAEQDPQRLMAAARRYAAMAEKDKSF